MTSHIISSIYIEKLFGIYSYKLPVEGTFSPATILYGENGVGKSTVLRLVFHLLSSAGDRGHRGFLYKSDYKTLKVTLVSGIVLSAERREETEDMPVILQLSITKDGATLAEWHYAPESEYKSEKKHYYEMKRLQAEARNESKGWFILGSNNKEQANTKLNVRYDQARYMVELKKCVPDIYILDADRRLDSDDIPNVSDEIELRSLMSYESLHRLNDLVARSREVALSQALAAAAKWISRTAVTAANQGATNVHAVYKNILEHIETTNSSALEQEAIKAEELKLRMAAIEKRTLEFARYELTTSIEMQPFISSLGTVGKGFLLARLLEPYISSLEGRNNAVDPIYKIIDRFITISNELFLDKEVKFSLATGISIYNKNGLKLEVSQLSSGEQQLLLLFCYVLVGRDRPSVFMIDEPEISLNIKWQRQIISALLEITQGSNIQFIFASHSMELIAQHRESVVQLRNN